MGRFFVLLALIFCLFGCSQRSKLPSTPNNVMGASTILDHELSRVTEELPQAYELTSEEIALLKAEKLLDEEDAQELAKLIK